MIHSYPLPKGRFACQRHGEHSAYIFLCIEPYPVKIYCLICIDEAMTRLGVHGMFPVRDEPTSAVSAEVSKDEFPKDLEE